MQRALRVDLAHVLCNGLQLPGWHSSSDFLTHCANIGSPYLGDALAGIGCTESVIDDPVHGQLPTFCAPAAAMVDALKNEYLDAHPWYHTE